MLEVPLILTRLDVCNWCAMDPAVSAFRVNENPGITAYARDSDLNLLLILKVFWWRFANIYSCPMTRQGGCYKWVSKSDESFNFPILNRAKIENNVHNIYMRIK